MILFGDTPNLSIAEISPCVQNITEMTLVSVIKLILLLCYLASTVKPTA